jgi:hypothetical protein
VSTTARVPSRHGLRNAYSTQPSSRSLSLSSAIGGLVTLSSRTRAKPRSVASARELGRLPQPYFLYGEDSRPTPSGAQQERCGALRRPLPEEAHVPRSRLHADCKRCLRLARFLLRAAVAVRIPRHARHGEAAAVFFLRPAGIQEAEALAASVAFRLAVLPIAAIGVVSLASRARERR